MDGQEKLLSALVLHQFTVALVACKFFRLPFIILGLHTRARQVDWFPTVCYFMVSKKHRAESKWNSAWEISQNLPGSISFSL